MQSDANSRFGHDANHVAMTQTTLTMTQTQPLFPGK